MSVGTNLMMSTEMERHSLPLPHILPLIGDPGMTREQMNDALTCVLQFNTRQDASALVWMGYDQILHVLPP